MNLFAMAFFAARLAVASSLRPLARAGLGLRVPRGAPGVSWPRAWLGTGGPRAVGGGAGKLHCGVPELGKEPEEQELERLRARLESLERARGSKAIRN